MASGLAALLDDVAAIAKLAAASLDDVTAAAGKAGVKAAGVVVDDAAVTPGYAIGFTPDRELPIVWKIALGSLRNKFLFLLPGALLLSAFAPWAVTPILMAGGAYLCFEAAEKIIEAVFHASSHDTTAEIAQHALGAVQLEARKVAGAIRTDLILSGEIMAIALATVADRPLAIQAGALALVGFVLTVAVYGVVGLIVKMDDVGVHLARRDTSVARLTGRGLVRSMPYVLDVLSIVGTAAMLWVGGGIIVHGLEHFGSNAIPHLIDELSERVAQATPLEAALRWTTFAVCSAVVGFVIGSVIVTLVHFVSRRKH
jgi:predicted DNA repair protein MutK